MFLLYNAKSIDPDNVQQSFTLVFKTGHIFGRVVQGRIEMDLA